MNHQQFNKREEAEYKTVPHRPFVSQPQKSAPHILEGKTVEQYLEKFYGTGMIFGQHEILSRGQFKLMGWLYDFRNHLQRYFVEFEYGIYSYYAPNKAKLRKALVGNGEIYNIVEVA